MTTLELCDPVAFLVLAVSDYATSHRCNGGVNGWLRSGKNCTHGACWWGLSPLRLPGSISVSPIMPHELDAARGHCDGGKRFTHHLGHESGQDLCVWLPGTQ